MREGWVKRGRKNILRVGLVVLVTVALERRVNAILIDCFGVVFGWKVEVVIGSELVEEVLLVVVAWLVDEINSDSVWIGRTVVL